MVQRRVTPRLVPWAAGLLLRGGVQAALPEVVQQQGGFYGICWQTDEGRALAAKVPSKGKPYPSEE